MKKLLKIVGILVILGAIFIVGYFVGHKVGRMYGAQQYTKKLWNTDEMQISASQVLEKINAYRKEKNLAPFQETNGLCKLARYRAKEATGSFGSKWTTETQKYEGVESPQELHKTELSPEKAKELCPECIFETQGENAYISVRPEPCFNLEGEKICVGGEEFGVVENYTDRIMNGWINSRVHNELLLSPIKYGCVGSYGGVVMLEVAEVK